MSTSILNGIGQALRWLRESQGLKQYQVAEAAGVTKGMLSAYETGRQRPSVETLEKVLDILGCDLNDLHNAIQIINGRPERLKRRGEEMELVRPAPRPESGRAHSEVMLDGFHRLLRYLHDRIEGASPAHDEPKSGEN